MGVQWWIDDRVPRADRVRIAWCGGPDCDRPHVVLFDRDGKPIAQFVVPDRRPDGGSFVEELATAFIQGEMLRGVRR